MSDLSICADLCGARCCKMTNMALPLHPEDDKGIFPIVGTALDADGNVYPQVYFRDYPDGKCPNLTDDNRCREYERRPKCCREWPHGVTYIGCLLSGGRLGDEFTGHRQVAP